jgi:hypothetical protein
MDVAVLDMLIKSKIYETAKPENISQEKPCPHQNGAQTRDSQSPVVLETTVLLRSMN